jgi:hypothetical protein
MKNIRFSDRVDFTYIIGAGISFLLIIVTVSFYKNSGLPMAFSMASFGSYSGVIIRGLFDRESWGKTEKQMRWSVFFGFTSVFVIVFIESVLLLTTGFELSKAETWRFIFCSFTGLIIIYFLLYAFWFKKQKPDSAQLP